VPPENASNSTPLPLVELVGLPKPFIIMLPPDAFTSFAIMTPVPESCCPGFVPREPPTLAIPDALAYPLRHEFMAAQLAVSGSFVPPAIVILPPYELIEPIMAMAPPPELSVSLYIEIVNGFPVDPLIELEDDK